MTAGARALAGQPRQGQARLRLRPRQQRIAQRLDLRGHRLKQPGPRLGGLESRLLKGVRRRVDRRVNLRKQGLAKGRLEGRARRRIQRVKNGTAGCAGFSGDKASTKEIHAGKGSGDRIAERADGRDRDADFIARAKTDMGQHEARGRPPENHERGARWCHELRIQGQAGGHASR